MHADHSWLIGRSSEPVMHAALTWSVFVLVYTHVWSGFTGYAEHFEKSLHENKEIEGAKRTKKSNDLQLKLMQKKKEKKSLADTEKHVDQTKEREND